MPTPNPKVYLTIVVLLFSGFLFFFSSSQKKPEESLVDQDQQIDQAPPIEVFSLAGIISKVENGDNYFLVKGSGGEEKEIKVVLNQKTEIIQLKFPFDLKNPPKEASFTPQKISIKIEDLAEGDNVLVEADTNIYDKAEFDSVSRVQVLP